MKSKIKLILILSFLCLTVVTLSSCSLQGDYQVNHNRDAVFIEYELNDENDPLTLKRKKEMPELMFRDD